MNQMFRCERDRLVSEIEILTIGYIHRFHGADLARQFSPCLKLAYVIWWRAEG